MQLSFAVIKRYLAGKFYRFKRYSMLTKHAVELLMKGDFRH